MSDRIECPDCLGHGCHYTVQGEVKCETCDGYGWVEKDTETLPLFTDQGEAGE